MISMKYTKEQISKLMIDWENRHGENCIEYIGYGDAYNFALFLLEKGYIIFQNRDEQKNRNEIISILKRKGYHIDVIEPSHYYEWGGIQISW